MKIRGLYIIPPHGKLIYDREKTIIATGGRVQIEGERAVCSKSDSGDGCVFGIARIGQPSIISTLDFDARFSSHRVTKSCRRKWWPDHDHLYCYPVLGFEKFDPPLKFNVKPGTTLDMGEIDIPFDFQHLVTEKAGGTIKAEVSMPWKPSDAVKYTKKADTPEKQTAWARVANETLEDCDGERSECEQRAIRAANAVVSRTESKSDDSDDRDSSDNSSDMDNSGSTDGSSNRDPPGDDGDASGEKAGDDGEGDAHVCTCANCGTQAESDAPCHETQCPGCTGTARGDSDENTKSGDHKDSDTPSNLSSVLKAAYTALKAMFSPGEDSNGKKNLTPGIKSLGTDTNGRDWFALFPTNAYLDDEGEFFETKALHNYVRRHQGESEKGVVDFFHVPGSEYATVREQAVVGDHIVCQLCTYDDTLIGKSFKEFFSKFPDSHPTLAPGGWGASHEFDYKSGDRATGVYTVFDIRKSTVLPRHRAANKHNPAPVLGGFKMNDEQKAAFDAIGKEIGVSNLADTVTSIGMQAKQALDTRGVPRKSMDEKEQVPTEDKSQGEEGGSVSLPGDAIRVIVQAIDDEVGFTQLSGAIVQMQNAISQLQAENKSLNKALGDAVRAKEEEVKNSIGSPRYAWMQGFQPSTQGPPPPDAMKSHTPHVPAFIDAMTERHVTG